MAVREDYLKLRFGSGVRSRSDGTLTIARNAAHQSNPPPQKLRRGRRRSFRIENRKSEIKNGMAVREGFSKAALWLQL